MATLDFFDPTAQAAKSGKFEAIPAAYYDLEIKEADVVPSATTPGTTNLKLIIKVISGEHEGRLLYAYHGISQVDKEKELKARERVTQLYAALNIRTKVRDTAMLCGIPFKGYVTRGLDKQSGEYTNGINDYQPFSFVAPVRAASSSVKPAGVSASNGMQAPQGVAAPSAPANFGQPVQQQQATIQQPVQQQIQQHVIQTQQQQFAEAQVISTEQQQGPQGTPW